MANWLPMYNRRMFGLEVSSLQYLVVIWEGICILHAATTFRARLTRYDAADQSELLLLNIEVYSDGPGQAAIWLSSGHNWALARQSLTLPLHNFLMAETRHYSDIRNTHDNRKLPGLLHSAR